MPTVAVFQPYRGIALQINFMMTLMINLSIFEKPNEMRVHHGRDRMVVEFTTTYVISA